MVQTSDQPTQVEQHFTHAGLTWDEFKAVQSLFEAPGVRVSYFQGEVELLTVSDLHGIIAGNLGFLLELYMTELDLDFFGTEDYSIEAVGLASAQADKSYCFGERRSIPDLAVEIVIKGERETKLNRYAPWEFQKSGSGLRGKLMPIDWMVRSMCRFNRVDGYQS